MKITFQIALAFSFATILGSATQIQAEDKRGFGKRPKKGLLETSTILQSRGKIAIVPKGAIIVLPKQHENKIVTGKAKGKVVSWKKFLTVNSTWIHMYPVSFDQAAGRKKISPEQLKGLLRLNKVVIAKRGTNLISVSSKALELEKNEEPSSQ